MALVREQSWREYRDSLFSYSRLDLDRRQQLVFRGQSDARWALQTTLDRHKTFASDADRERYVRLLLRAFSREALGVRELQAVLPEGEALELLARHHGLPSPLIDWTYSPYIAAYFAFAGATASTVEVAVWMLDRTKLPSSVEKLDIIDDPALLRFNRRALQQHGMFLRIASIREPLETWLADALVKFVLPASEREVAMADLDAMTINATTLFCDLDGAARTVAWRYGR